MGNFWQKSTYNDTTDRSFHGQYIMATRPKLFKSRYVSITLLLEPSQSTSYCLNSVSSRISWLITFFWVLKQDWYNPDDVISAWDTITSAALSEPLLQNSLNFRHDFVDITRQSVVELFDLSYSKLLVSYCDKNATALQ